MAVIIRKYQNDNKNQTHSYGKWYPRVVNLKTIDLDGALAALLNLSPYC